MYFHVQVRSACTELENIRYHGGGGERVRRKEFVACRDGGGSGGEGGWEDCPQSPGASENSGFSFGF